MFSFSKTKIVIVSTCCAGIFILGRATAPKPKPEIRYIDNTKSIEEAFEKTRQQLLQDVHKNVVIEKHTTKSKEGKVETNVKEVISYNKNSSEKFNSEVDSKSKISERQSAEVKEKYSGIDYTFMVGKSWDVNKYDYLAEIGMPINLPIFGQIKVNTGYEFNNKMIFIGGTLNF